MAFAHFRRHRARANGREASPNDIEVQLPDLPFSRGQDSAGEATPSDAPKMTRSTTVRISASGHIRAVRPAPENNNESNKINNKSKEESENEEEGSDLPDDATTIVQDQPSDSYSPQNARSAFIEKLWQGTWARRGKKVDAPEDILANYHDSVLYAPMTFSTKCRSWLSSGWSEFWRNWLEFLVSVLAMVLYIRWTYNQALAAWYLTLNALVSAYFVVHYVVELYSAPVRNFYILSPAGILDLLSILPVFWVFKHSSANALQIFRFLRILRIQTVLKRLGVLGTSVVHAICVLLINVFGIIFIFAALFQFVETRWPPKGSDCPEHGCIPYFTAFYFIIVTISTVGYGDVTPDTSWGMVVAILCIFTALVVIPAQLSGIITLFNTRPYGGNFQVAKVVGSRYIIIAGNLDFRTIQSFLAHLFHPGSTKDLAAFPLRVVLMAPYTPSFELKGLISLYAGNVEFIQGVSYRRQDLERVGAKAASTIFLLPDKSVENRSHDDSQSFIRALIVSRYVGKRTRVVVQLAEPDSLGSPIWDGSHVEVLCPEELRMRLLARSCFVRGLSTFLTNLFTRAVHFRKPQKDWLAEYYHGTLQQVFPVLLPKAVLGMPFEQATELFYLQYGVTLFALDVLTDGVDGERHVYLFPLGHVITSNDVGLVITATLQSAERVSKFGHVESSQRRKQKERESFMLCNCALCIRVDEKKLAQEEAALRALQESWGDEGLESGHYTVTHTHSRGSDSTLSAFRSKRLSSIEGRSKQVRQLRTVMDNPKMDRKEGDVQHMSDDGRCERVASLEHAVERLLAWPPITNFGKPTAAVIEKQEAAILANLKERTLTICGQEKGAIILVCIPNKPPADLYHFLAELRDDRVPFRNVVILHPTELPATIWGQAGLFEGVYFVKGSPMFELDLLRAGVLQADKVIVFSEDGFVQTAPDNAREEGPPPLASSRFVNDVNNLVTVSAIERLPRADSYKLTAADADPSEEPEWSGRVLAEMQRPFTFLFMRPQSYFHPRKFDYLEHKRNDLTPSSYALSYAEGKAWCPEMLECLVHATFSNKQTTNIMRQLVAGGDIDGLEEDTDAQDSRQRLLETISVPAEYAGGEYKGLLVGLLHNQGYLALGLYRSWGTKKAPIGYVVTNPPGETLVQKTDLVYILR